MRYLSFFVFLFSWNAHIVMRISRSRSSCLCNFSYKIMCSTISLWTSFDIFCAVCIVIKVIKVFKQNRNIFDITTTVTCDEPNMIQTGRHAIKISLISPETIIRYTATKNYSYHCIGFCVLNIFEKWLTAQDYTKTINNNKWIQFFRCR